MKPALHAIIHVCTSRSSRPCIAMLTALAMATAVPAGAATVGLRGKAPTCSAGWDTGSAQTTAAKNLTRVVCHDGDATCDADATANGECTIGVAACVAPEMDGCTPSAVQRLRVSGNARKLPGFALPDVSVQGVGDAGAAHLVLRGKTKSKASRQLKLTLSAKTAGGSGTSRVVLQCIPAVAEARCPDRAAAGLPKQLTYLVPGPGSDLDSGWSGVSHNFPIINGASLKLCLSDCDATTNPVCSAHGDVGPGSLNGSTFGPPLPLLTTVGVPVCVVNRFAGPISNTVNLQTGAMEGMLNLLSDVYALTPMANVCPRCENAVDPASAIGSQGHCVGGATPGAVCTVQGTIDLFTPTGTSLYKLSSQCLPAGNAAGTLDLAMPLTTATSQLGGSLPCPGQAHDDSCGAGTCSAECAGAVTCPQKDAQGQCVDVKGGIAQTCCSNDPNKSCFPTAIGAIVRTGAPLLLTPAWPDPTYPKTASGARVVAAFCEPSTHDPTVDTLSGLPGPGSLMLQGNVTVTAQE